MKPTLPANWTEAANTLAAILEAENAALRATDFAAAADLLAAKQIAIARLELARPSGPKFEIRHVAARLEALTQQNRSLLTDGIGIQAQVLGIIAGAIRAASATGYGPTGLSGAGCGGYALSAKA
jgi:hypothetical protein